MVDRGRCGWEVVIFNTTKPWRVSEADRFSCCGLPWTAPSRELHSTGETMTPGDLAPVYGVFPITSESTLSEAVTQTSGQQTSQLITFATA